MEKTEERKGNFWKYGIIAIVAGVSLFAGYSIGSISTIRSYEIIIGNKDRLYSEETNRLEGSLNASKLEITSNEIEIENLKAQVKFFEGQTEAAKSQMETYKSELKKLKIDNAIEKGKAHNLNE